MRIEIDTKYDINDKVIVKESCSDEPETIVYNTGKKDEDGDSIFDIVPIVYTIDGIQVDLGTRTILYNISYNNEDYVFPVGSRTVAEKFILEKI